MPLSISKHFIIDLIWIKCFAYIGYYAALISITKKEIQKVPISKVAEIRGVSINQGKTKYMISLRQNRDSTTGIENWRIQVQKLNNFIYS